MTPLRIHILYEHGSDLRPFGSAYIRLLRPLTHPVFRDYFEVTADRVYDGTPVDAVIVDRLWRPDVCRAAVEHLRELTRQSGVRLFHAIDDNLLALATAPKDWLFTKDQMDALDYLIPNVDGMIVTTPALKEQLAIYNDNIAVVPNLLDERLLDDYKGGMAGDLSSIWGLSWKHISRNVRRFLHHAGRKRVTIGYMGTFTHDDDLLMILPALHKIFRRYGNIVYLVVLGVAAYSETLASLAELPVHLICLKPQQSEYPHFMRWFSQRVFWDIAISPLCDDDFNRCKSDIKFLDYSAIGAAGIYSRVPAYMGSVVHGETGWLAENTTEAWVEALETLILDASLRRRIAFNARQYLYAERIVARAARYWIDAFESLLTQR